MNTRQKALYQVICSLVQSENFVDNVKFSEIRYGFLNYVAKYSLSRDVYYLTKDSKHYLEAKGFIKNSQLLRGLKSKKNGFTYEHPVPANVIADEILRYSGDQDMIAKILAWTDRIVVLTTSENDRFPKGLVSSMPDGWRFFKDSTFSRYFEAGLLKDGSELEEITVFGAVKR